MNRKYLASLIIYLFCTVIVTAGNWPDWRGPNQDGSTDEKGVVKTFSETENVIWSTDMPGVGASTPLVVEGKIFLTSADKDDNSKLYALCLDQKSGNELWRKEFPTNGRKVPLNNLVSSSAATDGKAVYFLFGSGDLAAYDYNGNELWARKLEQEFGNISIKFGYSSSPLIYDGKLFVLIQRRPQSYRKPDSDTLDSFLLAIDPKTGKDIYRHIRLTDAIDEALDSYSSPMPFDLNGSKQIVIMAADYVTGHDAHTGKEEWRYQYAPKKNRLWRNIASVVTADGIVYGVRSRGSGLFALKPANIGKLDESHVLWTYDGPTPDSSTPLIYRGSIYVVDDVKKKVLSCLDLKTGEQKWQQKLPGKNPYYASFTASDGIIYGMDESGDVIILAADSTKFDMLANVDLDAKPSRSSIAIADGNIFIRTAKKLYCIGKK